MRDRGKEFWLLRGEKRREDESCLFMGTYWELWWYLDKNPSVTKHLCSPDYILRWKGNFVCISLFEPDVYILIDASSSFSLFDSK
jgi:hypothetical protein